MKQNQIANYLKLGILLFGISLLLVNCQKDDNFQNIEIKEEVVIRPITVSSIQRNQILENKKVWNNIEKLETELTKFNTSSQNRTVYSNGNGLTINTEFATFIEFENGYHSYTFLVNNTPEGEGLRNVLLSLQEDGSYKGFLVHYSITDQEIELIGNGQAVDFGDRFTMTEIQSEFSEQLFSKILYQDNCTILEYVPDTCSGPGSGGHVYGEACLFIGDDDPNTFPPPNSGDLIITDLGCSQGGGSQQGGSPNDGGLPGGNPPGYNPGDTNDNPHGTGGNTTAPTSCGGRKCVPVDTDPIPSQVEIDQKNCDELNRIGNSTYTASAFNTLNNNLSQNTETGFSLDIRPNFPNFAPIPKQLISDSEVTAGQNPFSFAFLHNHFIGKFEMFGHGDIHTLFRYANNFNPSLLPNYQFDNSLFTIFMTVRNHTYAIKIEDIDKLASIQQYFVDESAEEIFKRQLDKVFKDANRDSNGNRRPNPADADQEELAQAFLKFVSETNDFGIALYKANTDDMISQNATWQKLTLDTNGNITPTNCN
ncbi:hypothetical protein [Bizionia sp.]|uniref:hypothetical protein n=1 Tax=Bizionia sp. TaxID=1954480 RepID=UPI003A9391C9